MALVGSRRRAHEKAYRSYLDASQRRQRLVQNLDALSATLGASNSIAVQPAISQIRHDLDALEQDLSSFLPAIHVSAQKPAGAAAMRRRAFEIPELLELILSNLDNRTLLKVYGVSRLFYNAIESSPMLQRQLGLTSAPGSAVALLPYRLQRQSNWTFKSVLQTEIRNSFLLGGSAKVEAKERKVLVEISVEKPFAALGSRCRSMLICQPPVQFVKAYPSCCFDSFHWGNRPAPSRPHVVTAANPSGVTVGDLQDAATRITEEQRLCINASAAMLDDDGYVVVQIKFKADLVVEESDPLWQENLAMQRRTRAKQEASQAKQEELRPYVHAKIAAKINDLPIPTLAEFKAQHGIVKAP